jgi:hypothetical protein
MINVTRAPMDVKYFDRDSSLSGTAGRVHMGVAGLDLIFIPPLGPV